MPANGGNPARSDEEEKEAVDYIINEVQRHQSIKIYLRKT
jgi:hypothetical protein